MKYLKAALLGAVQGLTEFLPVSSSGHLVLLEKCGFGTVSAFYNLALHLATLLAVCVVMRGDIASCVKKPFTKYNFCIVLCTVVTAAIALALSVFAAPLVDGMLLPTGFMLTSFALVCGETARCKGKEMGIKSSCLLGLVQGVAALPGVSRSGSTVAAMRLMGADAGYAVRFSFLLSLPVIAGGFVYEGAKSGFCVQGVSAGEVIVGFVTAFVFGVIALKTMLKRTKKGLMPFAVYTAIMGVISFFAL